MITMKAVRVHEYGGPEVLKYEDAPRPEPDPGDALVRVMAAAVNPVDWKIRQGLRQSVLPYALPMVPGWDVSGIVESVGSNVTGFAPGDEVFARPDLKRSGAYAEFISVRATELAKKPRSLDHVHAAAVPLAAMTAWQVLFDAPAPYSSMNLQRGQAVLIHGAAGGVGTFAVQLAKWRGARVVATASPANADFLRDLGADEVIDYSRRPFEEIGSVDAVFDTIGGETQARSWKVLKPGGVLASILSRPSDDDAHAHGARGAHVVLQPIAAQLTEIAALIDSGTLRPVVTHVLPLHDARKAHELSQTGHVRGKIVLNVAES